MKKSLKIPIVIVFFVLLAGIRFFEHQLFYDPLLRFYEGDFKQKPPPDFEEWRLILNTAFRYLLNTVVSLSILFAAFGKWNIIKFSAFVYMLAFVVLIGIFTGLIFNMSPENYFSLFYVRRFLIQPLFILLLLPAFYYQQYQKR